MESYRAYRSWMFLAGGIRKANSLQPLKVAKAMEGLTVGVGAYQSSMRPADHQAQLPLVMSLLTADAKYKQEGTPWGFKLLKTYKADSVTEPTTCNMKRPPGA
jgi:branched-chain amino acid transport system substrate-binding protein